MARRELLSNKVCSKGIDLFPTLVALMQWGDRYVAGDRGPAIVLEHKACGHEITPEFVCPDCGERVHAGAMRARVGPGAIGASA